MTWTKRDLLLYALGIGAKHDELEYVYGEYNVLQVWVSRRRPELGLTNQMNAL